MTTRLLTITNQRPQPKPYRQQIGQCQFNAILFDPTLVVVEKHFHHHNETQHVLFVIENDEIAFVAVKEINEHGTRIYKEI